MNIIPHAKKLINSAMRGVVPVKLIAVTCFALGLVSLAASIVQGALILFQGMSHKIDFFLGLSQLVAIVNFPSNVALFFLAAVVASYLAKKMEPESEDEDPSDENASGGNAEDDDDNHPGARRIGPSPRA